MTQIEKGRSIPIEGDKIRITIKKEYFRERFKEVITRYIESNRLDGWESNLFLDDLMKCFEEEGK